MKKLILLLGIGFGTAAQTLHTATLSWTDPNNPAGMTYNVYRASGACAATTTFPTTPINTAPITALTYTDSGMAPGTYCYVITAVAVTTVAGGTVNLESLPSVASTDSIVPFAPVGVTIKVK